MPEISSPTPCAPPFSLREELVRGTVWSRILALSVIPAGVFSAGAAPAGADPAAPSPENPPNSDSAIHALPPILVTGAGEGYKPELATSPKYPEPLLDTPQSISIVPHEVIVDQNATSLRDIMRNVPGVTIQAGEGGNTPGDNFIIRGFSARTDLYQDGVRDVNGFYRDPFDIEQVEVTKGPAGAFIGRGSTGGFINIITKKPTTTPFYIGTGSVGTDDFYRGTLDINQPIRLGWDTGKASAGTGKDDKGLPSTEEPEAALRVNAMWHNSDFPGRQEVNSERWGIAPSFTIGFGSPTQLTLSYYHLEENNMPDFGIPWVTATNNVLASKRNQPASVSFSNYYGLNQRDHEELRTDEFTAIVNHNINDSLDARALFHYGRNYRDSIISAPRFISDDSDMINREFQSRDEIDQVLTTTFDVTWRPTTFGFEHTLLAGLEFTRENSQNRLRSNPMAPLADLYDPNDNDHFIGSNVRTGDVNEAVTNDYAVYLFDVVKLGWQWELSGGLRAEYYSANYDQDAAEGPNTAFRRIDKELSWRAALAYKPVPFGTVYFGFGTSFNPSAEGLTLTADTALLEPERSTSYEIGTKWEVLDRRLLLSGAVFYTQKENSRTPGASPDDPGMVLEGEQQALGFELEARGKLTKNWEVIAGYTYADTQIVKSNTPAEVGSELPGVPRNSFTLWTEYKLPWNLEVGFGSQFVDQRFANPTNTRNGGSYVTFDAMVAYRVNKNLSLRLNVYNLTDETYIAALHTAGSFGHFIPGPRRSATLTATLEF
jgi:catecholate siderophore receptor